jgi:hypothetical protein
MSQFEPSDVTQGQLKEIKAECEPLEDPSVDVLSIEKNQLEQLKKDIIREIQSVSPVCGGTCSVGGHATDVEAGKPTSLKVSTQDRTGSPKECDLLIKIKGAHGPVVRRSLIIIIIS